MTLKPFAPSLFLSRLFFLIFSTATISTVTSQVCPLCYTGNNCDNYICDQCGDSAQCLNESKCVSNRDKERGIFCINGGACGSYIVNGCHYDGCHCGENFYGAHCQYDEETWKLGILDETAVPLIDPKFYTKDITCRSYDPPIEFMFISAGFVCFFLLFFAILCKYLKTAKKLKHLQVQVTKELDLKHFVQESSRHIVCIEPDRSENFDPGQVEEL